MDIAQLIEIGLAGVDRRRVEVMALEPAEIATEAVAGLAQLVFELAANAISFSAPEETVHVAGLFVGDNYLISISDRGVGVSDNLLGALNRMLEDPDSAGRSTDLALGLRFVARLAARQGLSVRLVPGAPGTTARVTVPANLVQRLEGDTVDLSRIEESAEVAEAEEVPDAEQGSSPSETQWRETESFLEGVFAPLRQGRGGSVPESSLEERPSGGVALLRARVPGDSFPADDDDSPSTTPSEGAVDLRSALNSFDNGRRSAQTDP